MKKSAYIALLLLIVGSGIYATCRQNVFFLVPFRGTKFLEWIKIDVHYQNGNIFTYFLLFCLPDVLWYIALLLLQIPFYNRSRTNKIFFYVAASLPFIFEFLKYIKVISGTFDIVDIIFYLVTFLIFLFIWKRKQLIISRKSHL